MTSGGSRRKQRPHLARPRLRWGLTSARVRAALGLGVVLSAFATGTFATWTDAAIVSGTTFEAGTIDLVVNDADSVSGYTALNLDSMVPGDSMASVLTIKNDGTAPLTYTADSAATNADGMDLRDSLVVHVTDAAAVTGTSPAMTCDGTALAGAETTLDGPLLSTGRVLGVSASETVCVQVTLDGAASAALEGATTDVVFTFNANSDVS